MPNTFVHLGMQTPISRSLLQGADFKWIALGCIIPDLPWIIQRLLLAAADGLHPYYLCSYVTVQASLFCSLILCGGLALAAAGSSRIFILLAVNSLLHLLLDAMQIKWANGVHLLAPFSWKMTSFNLFWPEHVITYVLTILGMLVLGYFGIREWKIPVVLSAHKRKWTAALLLLALYFTVPLVFISAPITADNHYLRTLLDREERPGKYVELDRSRYRDSDRTVRIFSGERLGVTGDIPQQDAMVSMRGTFADADTIHISSSHVHSGMRDLSSKAALFGVLLVWAAAAAGRNIVIRT